MTVLGAPPQPQQQERRGVERTIRTAGLVVLLVATVVTAVAELFLTPLRLGGIPVGIAVPFAAAANWGLAWFAAATSGRWAIALPWALWTLLMMFAAGARTTEGDHLLGGNDWVALVMILVGSLTFAIYAYRAILHRPVVTAPRIPAELRDHPAAHR